MSWVGELLTNGLAVSAEAIESVQKSSDLGSLSLTLWQQLLDEQEFGQDEGDDGDDQGLLGDQGDSEESDDGESSNL